MILVGYDGSDGSQAALEFAAEEARLRGTRLRIVYVWHVPASVYASIVASPVDLGIGMARNGEETLKRAAESVDGVEVDTEVVEGAPADVLTRLTADADLVVVGSRGLGGFGGLLLGSVSQQVATHAHCPVVIVRAG